MASNKIFRINEDIRFVLSDLLRNIKDPRVSDQGLLSVVSADTTGDLRYCKVYISAFGMKDEKELRRGLKSAAGYLRRELGRRLNLRYTPELIFEVDKSIEHGAHINDIISGLDIPKDPEDTDNEEDNTI